MLFLFTDRTSIVNSYSTTVFDFFHHHCTIILAIHLQHNFKYLHAAKFLQLPENYFRNCTQRKIETNTAKSEQENSARHCRVSNLGNSRENNHVFVGCLKKSTDKIVSNSNAIREILKVRSRIAKWKCVKREAENPCKRERDNVMSLEHCGGVQCG